MHIADLPAGALLRASTRRYAPARFRSAQHQPALRTMFSAFVKISVQPIANLISSIHVAARERAPARTLRTPTRRPATGFASPRCATAHQLNRLLRRQWMPLCCRADALRRCLYTGRLPRLEYRGRSSAWRNSTRNVTSCSSHCPVGAFTAMSFHARNDPLPAPHRPSRWRTCRSLDGTPAGVSPWDL